MKILDFYSRLAKSLKVQVDDTGLMSVSTGNASAPYLSDAGIRFALPTKHWVDNMYTKSPEGAIVPAVEMFNPLNEYAVVLTPAQIKIKNTIENRLSVAVVSAVTLLIMLAATKTQQSVSINLAKFLDKLAGAEKSKNITDETTSKIWANIVSHAMTTGLKHVDIHVESRKLYKGTQYAKLASAAFPIFDILANAEVGSTVCGQKITRTKDAVVFKAIASYIRDGIVDPNTQSLSVGANCKEAPYFTALYNVYYGIATVTNKILEELKDLSESMYAAGYIELIDLAEIEVAGETYSNEISLLPAATDSKVPIKQTPVGSNKTTVPLADYTPKKAAARPTVTDDDDGDLLDRLIQRRMPADTRYSRDTPWREQENVRYSRNSFQKRASVTPMGFRGESTRY